MKVFLQQLLQNTPLSAQQAEAAFTQIMAGSADPLQTAALLTLLANREPSVSELLGAATVMRRHLLPIQAPKNVIDTCGTGGVGSSFFNISTAAAIVAAAAGVPVCKHGNRSVTSRSGSSDVLKILGVNLDTTPEQEAISLATANICFAYAPTHHPAMKHVAAIRQALGFSTLFNLLGPLANPAGARRQVIGTRSQTLADKLLEVLVTLGAERVIVLSGNDPVYGPVCEISLTGPTHIAQYDAMTQTTKRYLLSPQEIGLSIYPDSEAADHSDSRNRRRKFKRFLRRAGRDATLFWRMRGRLCGWGCGGEYRKGLMWRRLRSTAARQRGRWGGWLRPATRGKSRYFF